MVAWPSVTIRGRRWGVVGGLRVGPGECHADKHSGSEDGAEFGRHEQPEEKNCTRAYHSRPVVFVSQCCDGESETHETHRHEAKDCACVDLLEFYFLHIGRRRVIFCITFMATEHEEKIHPSVCLVILILLSLLLLAESGSIHCCEDICLELCFQCVQCIFQLFVRHGGLLLGVFLININILSTTSSQY